eukprot:205417_1
MDPQQYLDSQISCFPEASNHFGSLKSLADQKLYHQLTEKLKEIVSIPFFQANDTLLRLYDNFVTHFEKHLDKVEVSLFVIQASKQCASPEASVSFLESVEKKLDESERESLLLLQLERAQFSLDARPPRAEECKKVIEKARDVIDSYDGMLQVVYSTFYRIALQYHKLKGTASQYFQNALLFLGYTDLNTIPPVDRLTLAADLGVAALVGDVYNFGELLQHPVLSVLENTEHAWLGQLLVAFNEGDIDSFDRVFEAQRSKQPMLVTQESFLRRKIRIMRLMEMVFKRSSHDRTIKFQEISEICRLPVEEVELMLMEAMALEIVRGQIDELDQTVVVKWVQPRVLSLTQIAAMKGRLDAWSARVQDTVRFVEQPRAQASA